jgi:hypothetical protein
MSKYSADPNLLVALLLVVSAIAAFGLVMLYLSVRKQKQTQESAVVVNDWQPTGKVDFYCNETPKEESAPAPFLLRVEEYRTIESISGVEHTEVRWRRANLAEAKSVLLVHRNATDETKGSAMPKLVRARLA